MELALAIVILATAVVGMVTGLIAAIVQTVKLRKENSQQHLDNKAVMVHQTNDILSAVDEVKKDVGSISLDLRQHLQDHAHHDLTTDRRHNHLRPVKEAD